MKPEKKNILDKLSRINRRGIIEQNAGKKNRLDRISNVERINTLSKLRKFKKHRHYNIFLKVPPVPGSKLFLPLSVGSSPARHLRLASVVASRLNTTAWFRIHNREAGISRAATTAASRR